MTWLVDIGGQAEAVRTYPAAERRARQAVRDEGFPAAVVYYSDDEPEMPFQVRRIPFAIWRERTAPDVVEETRDIQRGFDVYRTRLNDLVRPIPLHLDPRIGSILVRAQELATGDRFEEAVETYEVAADLAEELGDLADAERSRIAALRLRIALWYAEHHRRREEITWQRVLPARNRRAILGVRKGRPPFGDWAFYVTPWDPEPGERYVVGVNKRGRVSILQGGSA